MLNGKGTYGHVNWRGGGEAELKLDLCPTTDYLREPMVCGVSQKYFPI